MSHLQGPRSGTTLPVANIRAKIYRSLSGPDKHGAMEARLNGRLFQFLHKHFTKPETKLAYTQERARLQGEHLAGLGYNLLESVKKRLESPEKLDSSSVERAAKNLRNAIGYFDGALEAYARANDKMGPTPVTLARTEARQILRSIHVL